MRYLLEYIPLLAIAHLVRLLPRSGALAFGRRLGTFAMRLQPKRVRIADDNLRHAFPEIPPRERQKIVRQVFGNLGLGFVEMLRLDMFDGKRDLDRLFTIEGAEHVHAALALGKGCLLLTGHIGFWEAGNFVLPSLGIPAGFVAKPMKNPLVDTYFKRLREHYGTYIIDSRKGARRIVRALQNNHLVGIVMDQHIARKEAVRVLFFGRPAYTTPIIAQIAMKHQVPVIAAFSYRNADNTYRIVISPHFFLTDDMSEANILASTQLLTEKIEAGVRHDISQWFWIHRRWKFMAPDE